MADKSMGDKGALLVGGHTSCQLSPCRDERPRHYVRLSPGFHYPQVTLHHLRCPITTAHLPSDGWSCRTAGPASVREVVAGQSMQGSAGGGTSGSSVKLMVTAVTTAWWAT